MIKSYFLKVFIGYLLILCLCAGAILVFSLHAVRDQFIQGQKRHLESLAEALKGQIVPFLDQGQVQELDSFSKTLGKKINARITFINPEGIVLADSDEDPAKMDIHLYRPEIFQSLQGRVESSLRYSTTLKARMLYMSFPLAKNEVIGVLRLSVFVKDINFFLFGLTRTVFRFGLIIFLAAFLATLLFTRTVSHPVRELAAAAQKVASGDFEAKVSLRHPGELRRLAKGFNDMTSKLKGLFGTLARQKEELNTVLSSIQDALIVIDADGRIVLSNESFSGMVHHISHDRRYYWEVIRSPRFYDLVKTAMEAKKNLTGDVSWEEKEFLCSVSFLPSQAGFIAVFHDLTEMKDIQRIKKDLVLNVSHEMRTPLTAVKGYVETLQEGATEEQRGYLKIIDRNTDRLIHIVEDLLSLSKLERGEGPGRDDREFVRVEDILQNVLRIFEKTAREKGISLEARLSPGLPSLRADPFQIEQMLVNLVDNGLKYTDKGRVSVALDSEGERYRIEVRDTGIGIPEEHLPHVFERFYVVDKSRSRKMGGTGLGLSIVKHIVQAHGGTVSVTSRLGEGATFTIELPL